MDANQTHAGAWVHDEALQTAAPLLHAAALRSTYVRQHKYNLDIARYAEPSQTMGKISFFAMCGDHLQLPPVPKSSGLLLVSSAIPVNYAIALTIENDK